MNCLPDTPQASNLETLHRPVPRSHYCMNEQTATADFHNLLDAPALSVENPLRTQLATEQTLETSIEASAWLALNAVETMPITEVVNARPSTSSTTPTTAVSLPELDCSSSALNSEVLPSSTRIQPEVAPLPIATETENTPVTSVSNTTTTEILGINTTLPIALNPALLPLFSFAEPVTAPPSLPVPNLQHPDFEHGIVTHLTWCANQSIGRAHIQIHPAHLGAIDVQLYVQDKQVHAAFFSPHNEVCQRLQESLPVLHRLLDEHGLHLAQADVNQQAPDSQAHTGSAKTTELSVVNKENTAEENKQSDNAQLYQPTTLLDTWA